MDATLRIIAETVVAAHVLREASWTGSRYLASFDQATEDACRRAGITSETARKLIFFLHVSGEGVDVARHMIEASSPEEAA
ncbi:MAG TPA: hypothetical protein PK264_18895 [Hyphomicrobiaceae bacterium]|nr:hypothetical protein [Hyphomicrobiaceae bacterium]